MRGDQQLFDNVNIEIVVLRYPMMSDIFQIEKNRKGTMISPAEGMKSSLINTTNARKRGRPLNYNLNKPTVVYNYLSKILTRSRYSMQVMR